MGDFWVVEVCFGAVQTDKCLQQSLFLGAVAGYLLLIKILCVSAQEQSSEEFEWCLGQGDTLTNDAEHLEQIYV